MKTQKQYTQKRGLVVRRSKTGLGLYTKNPIAKEDFIVEYKGPMLTSKQADIKGGKYLFEVNSRYTIDGSSRKNLARYINHSCEPNSEVDIKKQRILVFAKKNIPAGSELTYDYGRAYFIDYIRPYGCKCHAKKHKYQPRKKLKKAR